MWTRSDGDAYYQRNKGHRITWDPVAEVLEGFHTPGRVLDLGCCDGYRMDLLLGHARSYEGWDASDDAIDAAQEHTCVDASFRCGNFESWDLRGHGLVVASFVLHWLDRPVAFVERLVEAAPAIVINDFDPAAAVDVPFAHRIGVLTKKRPWGTILPAMGMIATKECRYRYQGLVDGEDCRCTLWRRP